jgi:hypothetical protein
MTGASLVEIHSELEDYTKSNTHIIAIAEVTEAQIVPLPLPLELDY